MTRTTPNYQFFPPFFKKNHVLTQRQKEKTSTVFLALRRENAKTAIKQKQQRKTETLHQQNHKLSRSKQQPIRWKKLTFQFVYLPSSGFGPGQNTPKPRLLPSSAIQNILWPFSRKGRFHPNILLRFFLISYLFLFFYVYPVWVCRGLRNWTRGRGLFFSKNGIRNMSSPPVVKPPWVSEVFQVDFPDERPRLSFVERGKGRLYGGFS